MMAQMDDLSPVASDEDDEAMTPAEVLEKLEEAWLNEKFSPELLENKAEIVDCIMEQIASLEENIQRAKKGDFKVSIHRMEIDRIRFVLSSYLRIRLQKIEKYTTHILENETPENAKLSSEEISFAKEYKGILEGHLKSMALRHMPQNLQNLDPKQTVVAPPVDSYVFLRVNEDIDGVIVEDETAVSREEVIDMRTGDQHFMRYRPVASLVHSGAITLM